MDKKISQHVICKMKHFQKRMEQRLKIKPSPSDILYLIKAIQGGKASFVERKSKYKTLWAISFKEKFIFMLYNKRHHILETAYRCSSPFKNVLTLKTNQ